MSLLARVREVVVLREASARMHRFLLEQVKPGPDERTVVIGEDPVRVLMVGAGVAVGYGVPTRAQALDGHLARLLAERSGRGVVVDTRVRPDLRLHDTVELLGAAGAHTFDLVVWSPTFREVFRVTSGRKWARMLDRIVGHLRSTGAPDTEVLLLGLPAIEAPTAITRLVMRRNQVANAAIARAADRARVGFVTLPALGRLRAGRAVCDTAYYARCADVIVPALLASLEGGRRPTSARER